MTLHKSCYYYYCVPDGLELTTEWILWSDWQFWWLRHSLKIRADPKHSLPRPVCYSVMADRGGHLGDTTSFSTLLTAEYTPHREASLFLGKPRDSFARITWVRRRWPGFLVWKHDVGVNTCKNRRPYNLYCVGADVKPCSINQSINHSLKMIYTRVILVHSVHNVRMILHCTIFLVSSVQKKDIPVSSIPAWETSCHISVRTGLS